MKPVLFITLLIAVLALSATATVPAAFAGCPSYDPNCQQPRP